jgi:hypothetical protein
MDILPNVHVSVRRRDKGKNQKRRAWVPGVARLASGDNSTFFQTSNFYRGLAGLSLLPATAAWSPTT